MTDDNLSTSGDPWYRGVLRSFVTTFGPLLALVAVGALFSTADYCVNDEVRFLTSRNLRTMAVQTSTVAVAALGMTVVIIAGGIDLSAGTALALAATVLAWLLKHDYSPTLAVAGSVGAGVACGLLNGIFISALRVVPFIVTLGTMTAYLGIGKIVSDETTVRPALDRIPAWLPLLVSTSPQPEWIVLPIGVWAVLLLAGLVAVVLRYTVFGRHVFAIGSSEATARLCGVNVPGTKIAVYGLSGLLVGIAGLYQFARLSSGNPGSGVGLELKIIAAVVIGGASLSGGRGTILGTLAGAAMMGVIANGCTLLGLSNPTQDIIIGAIIVAAVALDRWRQQGSI